VERGWNWASDENFVGNEEVSLGDSSSDIVPYVPMLFNRQPTPRKSSWHPSNSPDGPLTQRNVSCTTAFVYENRGA
jgi:hypothetical protein